MEDLERREDHRPVMHPVESGADELVVPLQTDHLRQGCDIKVRVIVLQVDIYSRRANSSCDHVGIAQSEGSHVPLALQAAQHSRQK